MAGSPPTRRATWLACATAVAIALIPADPTLPIPSNAHWMPLASLVQLPFMAVLGPTAWASALPFALIGALAAPMTLLFLAAEVIAHIHDRRKAREAALAGDDGLIRRSVQDDKAWRELSERVDDIEFDPPG